MMIFNQKQKGIIIIIQHLYSDFKSCKGYGGAGAAGPGAARLTFVNPARALSVPDLVWVAVESQASNRG